MEQDDRPTLARLPISKIYGASLPAASVTASTIFRYEPQRQMLPARCSRISSSVGDGFCDSSSRVAMRKPGVQYEHWNALCSTNACWIGCSSPFSESTSAVSIDRPAAWPARIRHELTCLPSTATVHEPQMPMPQDSRTLNR